MFHSILPCYDEVAAYLLATENLDDLTNYNQYYAWDNQLVNQNQFMDPLGMDIFSSLLQQTNEQFYVDSMLPPPPPQDSSLHHFEDLPLVNIPQNQCLPSQSIIQFPTNEDRALGLPATTQLAPGVAVPRQKPTLLSKDPNQPILYCKFCSQPFSRRNSLRRHEQLHTGQKPYQCRPCGRSFSRQDIFKRHCSSKRCRRLTHEVNWLESSPSDSSPSSN